MKKHILAAVAALTFSAPAMATTITFDDLAANAVVTTQYAGVTFSSITGSQVLTTAQNFGTSAPNFICAGRGGSINCADTIFVDFATAVSGLTFKAVGDNVNGVNGSVNAFNAAGVLLGSVNTLGDNDSGTPYLVDLTAFSGISRIAISNSDPAGLGYDDFNFVAATTAAVPEPATWAMMMLGFGAMGFVMRRGAKGTQRVRFA